MKIVIWSMNAGPQKRDEFTNQLVRGLKQDPDELHIVQEFPVSVTEAEVPMEGLNEDGYKIVVLSPDEDHFFNLIGDGFEDLDMQD